MHVISQYHDRAAERRARPGLVPAQFQWANGGEAMGLIPTRYPGSEKRGSGRPPGAQNGMAAVDDDTYIGLGQRILTTDNQEIGVLELRELRLGPAS